MAAHPLVILDDVWLAHIPSGFRSDPCYQKGSAVELRPLEEPRSGWRELCGIAPDVDGNAILEEERQRELRDEETYRRP